MFVVENLEHASDPETRLTQREVATPYRFAQSGTRPLIWRVSSDGQHECGEATNQSSAWAKRRKGALKLAAQMNLERFGAIYTFDPSFDQWAQLEAAH